MDDRAVGIVELSFDVVFGFVGVVVLFVALKLPRRLPLLVRLLSVELILEMESDRDRVGEILLSSVWRIGTMCSCHLRCTTIFCDASVSVSR